MTDLIQYGKIDVIKNIELPNKNVDPNIKGYKIEGYSEMPNMIQRGLQRGPLLILHDYADVDVIKIVKLQEDRYIIHQYYNTKVYFQLIDNYGNIYGFDKSSDTYVIIPYEFQIKYPLTHNLIDLIKHDMIKWQYQNIIGIIMSFNQMHEIDTQTKLICNISNKLDEQSKSIQEISNKLDEQKKLNQELSSKLVEQLELNKTLCKRLFELKEKNIVNNN